jgi:uncharacterized protein
VIATVVLAAALTAPPRPTEYVTDNAGALSSTTVQSLDSELQRYEKTTGHRIIVWIGQTTGDVPLEDWTIKAAETWKIGRAGKDDGAILFLFMQDRKIRIEVGYGLEGSLTDADSSLIINETIRPKMRAGDTDGAVQAGVDRMLLTITPSFKDQIGHQVAAESSSSSEDSPAGIIGSLIVFILVFGLIIFLARKQRGRGNAGLWFLTGALSSGGWGSSGGGGFGGGLGGGGFGGGFGGGGASGGW